MVEIKSYNFGSIVIDNNTYHKDLIIFEDTIKPNWWREKGHLLQAQDIKDLFSLKPTLMIIGTGAYGLMKVSEEVTRDLNKHKINYRILKTAAAVDLYNKLAVKSKVICALHLTC